MSILEILASGGGVILLLMTMVQIAPVKINPWRWVGRMIGRAITGEVSERLTGIEKKLDGHIDMDDRRTADGHRAQILHFNNELLRPIRHTKEEFIEVLAKIDAYEKYCDSHPDYPNNRAVLAIENIREIYRERMKKRDFLQESNTDREEGTP